MKERDPLSTSSYDYHLPSHLIAKSPAKRSRLLVYERATQSITHTTFDELLDFLPKESHLVFNDTKVIKARLFGQKESGGKIELLLNRPLPNGRFSVFIRGKVHPGTRLLFDKGLEAKVTQLHNDGSREVEFSVRGKPIEFAQLLPILERIGHVPLPPYIDRPDTKEDERHYQPIFAQKPGAVAAPTASLHFTPSLLAKIKATHPTHTITLHVGAGTFKPVEHDLITKHKMHTEYYEIPPSTIQAIQSDAPLVAVGTTVTRTIEYFVRTHKPSGECDLFLHPKNPPRRVDHLITNFHLPRSTLLMLVAAFVGIEQMHRIYQEAIEKKYRFYSYGDAMLIL